MGLFLHKKESPPERDSLPNYSLSLLEIKVELDLSRSLT